MRQTSLLVGSAEFTGNGGDGPRPGGGSGMQDRSECVDAGEFLADDELVYGFRTLVGDHALEV